MEHFKRWSQMKYLPGGINDVRDTQLSQVAPILGINAAAEEEVVTDVAENVPPNFFDKKMGKN